MCLPECPAWPEREKSPGRRLCGIKVRTKEIPREQRSYESAVVRQSVRIELHTKIRRHGRIAERGPIRQPSVLIAFYAKPLEYVSECMSPLRFLQSPALSHLLHPLFTTNSPFPATRCWRSGKRWSPQDRRPIKGQLTGTETAHSPRYVRRVLHKPKRGLLRDVLLPLYRSLQQFLNAPLLCTPSRPFFRFRQLPNFVIEPYIPCLQPRAILHFFRSLAILFSLHKKKFPD